MRALALAVVALSACQFDSSVVDSGRGEGVDPPLILSDGFEGGLGVWTGTLTEAGDSVEISSAAARSGEASLHCVTDGSGNGQAALYLRPGPLSVVSIGGHFMLPDQFRVGEWVSVIAVAGSQGGSRQVVADVLLRPGGGGETRLELVRASDGESRVADVSLGSESWHSIDLRVDEEEILLRFGGNPVLSLERGNDGVLVEQLEIGNVWQRPGPRALELYVDDVRVGGQAR